MVKDWSSNSSSTANITKTVPNTPVKAPKTPLDVPVIPERSTRTGPVRIRIHKADQEDDTALAHEAQDDLLAPCSHGTNNPLLV